MWDFMTSAYDYVAEPIYFSFQQNCGLLIFFTLENVKTLHLLRLKLIETY